MFLMDNSTLLDRGRLLEYYQVDWSFSLLMCRNSLEHNPHLGQLSNSLYKPCLEDNLNRKSLSLDNNSLLDSLCYFYNGFVRCSNNVPYKCLLVETSHLLGNKNLASMASNLRHQICLWLGCNMCSCKENLYRLLFLQDSSILRYTESE